MDSRIVGKKIVSVETTTFPDSDYGDENTGLVDNEIRLIFDDGTCLVIEPLETNTDWGLSTYLTRSGG